MAVQMAAQNRDFTRTATLPSATTFTLSMWVRIDTDRNTFSNAFSLDNGAGSPQQYVLLETDTDGTTMAFVSTANAVDFDITPIVNMTVGTWYWFCVCKSSNNATIYYAALGSSTISSVSTSGAKNPTVTTMRIGDDLNDAWLNGSVSAVKIWSGVSLSAAEAANERWAINAIKRDSLWAEYPFFQGGATTEAQTDYSGNGRSLSGGTSSTTVDGPNLIFYTPRNPIPRIAPTAPSGDMIASAAGTSTVSGTIGATANATGSAAGTCTVSGTIGAAGVIAATAAGTSTVSGAVTATAAASGSAAGAATHSATIAGLGHIAGTAAGAATCTATAEIEGDMIASTAGTCTVSGTLTATINASGSAAGTTTHSATIAGIGTLRSGPNYAPLQTVSAEFAGAAADEPQVVSFPGSATTGSLIVIVVVGIGIDGVPGFGVEDNKGNTYANLDGVIDAEQRHMRVFYAANATGGASMQFTVIPTNAQSDLAIAVIEFPGVRTTSPLDGTAHEFGQFAPAVLVPVGYPNELAIAAATGATTSLTAVAGWSTAINTTATASAVGINVIYQTSSTSTQAGWSGAPPDWLAVAGSFAPAGVNQATVTGELLGIGQMSASSLGISTAAGGIRGQGALSGSAAGVATASLEYTAEGLLLFRRRLAAMASN